MRNYVVFPNYPYSIPKKPLFGHHQNQGYHQNQGHHQNLWNRCSAPANIHQRRGAECILHCFRSSLWGGTLPLQEDIPP